MKKLSGLLVTFVLFGCSAASAQSYHYLGCQWFIPSNFVKIEPGLYREKFEPDNPQWNMASILFTTFNPAAVTSGSSESQETLVLKHPTDAEIQYYSSVIREGDAANPLLVQELLLVKDDKAVSLFGLTKAESLALTANCADPVTINEHFKLVPQVVKNAKAFLATEHGLTVL